MGLLLWGGDESVSDTWVSAHSSLGILESLFLCVSCLSVYAYAHFYPLCKSRTPRPHQTLLFTDGKQNRPGRGATWQLSGNKRRQKGGYKVLCDLSPSGGARVCPHLSIMGGLRDWLRGAAWPKRRETASWGKEASPVHSCTGLRGDIPPQEGRRKQRWLRRGESPRRIL